jgi:hypothetical protein
MPNTCSVSVSEIIVLHCSEAARNNTSKYVIKFYICKAQVQAQGHSKTYLQTSLLKDTPYTWTDKMWLRRKKSKLSFFGSVCVYQLMEARVGMGVRLRMLYCERVKAKVISVYTQHTEQKWVYIQQPLLQIKKTYHMFLCYSLCCILNSVTDPCHFWCGSGSADPCLWLTDSNIFYHRVCYV